MVRFAIEYFQGFESCLLCETRIDEGAVVRSGRLQFPVCFRMFRVVSDQHAVRIRDSSNIYASSDAMISECGKVKRHSYLGDSISLKYPGIDQSMGLYSRRQNEPDNYQYDIGLFLMHATCLALFEDISGTKTEPNHLYSLCKALQPDLDEIVWNGQADRECGQGIWLACAA